MKWLILISLFSCSKREAEQSLIRLANVANGIITEAPRDHDVRVGNYIIPSSLVESVEKVVDLKIEDALFDYKDCLKTKEDLSKLYMRVYTLERLYIKEK
ncbi:MAG: hypothetical protein DRQ88_12990 [Epsilonproteobacteria bacterium]|nr:MAG: hypothetical protein DRQ88_12990 [Campylobacterota bacterium]